MVELILQKETYAVIGAAMEEHNTLGCGFLEAVYQEAMEIELLERGIPFTAQKELPIYYKGHKLGKVYVADLIVYGNVLVEIKALGQITSREEAQVMNYLKATSLQVGILLNFGTEKLVWDRKVLTQDPVSHPRHPRYPRIKQEET